MYQIALDKIASELGIQYIGPEQIVPKRVVFDSRQVEPGDLFVAIRGQVVDGHRFVDKAIAAGAVAVAVDADHVPTETNVGAVIVEDGQAFIQQLGKWCRAQFHGPVIAVTGSQGKTSTKDLLSQVCRQSHEVVVTRENQNNELGMPLTLTRLTESTEILIVEMGMTGFNEIDFLCQIARPTHGIITGIGMVHAEYLGSQQGIARAKTELFRYLPENGTVALRKRDEALIQPYLSECAAEVKWCGDASEAADVTADHVKLGQEESSFECKIGDQALEITLPFAGKHYVNNALLVITVARSIDISATDIQNGLGSAVSLSSNRMEMHELDGGKLLINDCYNANPDSMVATLDVLAGYKPRPTVACLGNMYELGPYEQEGHALVGRHLANKGIDMLICLGQLAEGIGISAHAEGLSMTQIFNVDNTKQAAALLKEYAPENAVILVKGSNSMKMVEIYQYLQHN